MSLSARSQGWRLNVRAAYCKFSKAFFFGPILSVCLLSLQKCSIAGAVLLLFVIHSIFIYISYAYFASCVIFIHWRWESPGDCLVVYIVVTVSGCLTSEDARPDFLTLVSPSLKSFTVGQQPVQQATRTGVETAEQCRIEHQLFTNCLTTEIVHWGAKKWIW